MWTYMIYGGGLHHAEKPEGWRDAMLRSLFVCDFDLDGLVYLDDFAFLAAYWRDSDCLGNVECEDADSNADGKVDFTDVIVFAGRYLACSEDIP